MKLIYNTLAIIILQCLFVKITIAQSENTQIQNGAEINNIAQIPICDLTKATVYVDASRPDNSGDGYSWATAKKSLWEGLNISHLCRHITRINVAEGTYKPTTNPAQKDEMFFIRDLNTFFGGYPAGGGVRNHVLHPTILDGTIDVNNSVYHTMLVYAANNLLIDGFQIRGGNANGTGEAGLDSGNIMEENKGGGIYMKKSNNVTIKNCVFYHNRASVDGGAVYARDSNPTFYNTIFYNNQANYGPAVYFRNVENTTINIYHSNFHSNNNTDELGGAIYNNGYTVLNIANSILWGNYTPSIFDGAGDKIVTACILNEGTPNFYNHVMNPQYVNPANLKGPDGLWFTADDGMHLCSGSPGINRGLEITDPDVNRDITLNPRDFGRCDIGAYERQTVPIPEELAADQDTSYANIFHGASGESALFVKNSCKIIANIEPNGTNPIYGIVKAKAFIEDNSLIYNGMPLVKRHYEVHPTNNISVATAKVSLFFKNSNFEEYNNRPGIIDKLPVYLLTAPTSRSKLRVVKFGGTSPTGQPGTYSGPTTIIDPDDEHITYSNGIWKVTFEVSDFSGFFITASPATPLPLKLEKFEAKITDKSIVLNWETSQETNSSHFEIERSFDAQKFEKIGKEYSNESGTYEFLDNPPLIFHHSSLFFYRLKMVDLDGKFSYSKILAVDYNAENEQISIFPNPVQNKLYVKLSKIENLQKLKILDIKGQLIQESNHTDIDISKLVTGKYFIQIIPKSGKTIVKSFLKE